MRRRVHRGALVALVASLAFVGLPAGETSALAPAAADLVATAHATEGSPQLDVRSGVGRLPRSGTARTTATASATCPGCEATARAVHVVYANGPQVRADNVAVAWAHTCTDCSATAVSVQVVLARRASGLRPANRALAVNAMCDGCTSDALAVQFVISGGSARELSERAQELIDELATQLSLDLDTPRPGRPSAQATERHGSATLAAASPEARSVERVAAALRAEFGSDAVAVRIDARHDGP